MFTNSSVFRYGVALLAVVVALAARLPLQPWLGGTFPLATVFTAIAFVVWVAGAWPAVVTMLAGWAAAGVVFRGGAGFFNNLTVADLAGFAMYVAAAVPIILLGHAMRTATRRLEARQELLTSANSALESEIEAQSLLAAIVASSEDAIISKTLDGVVTSWNRGAEHLFGWSAREAIGRSIQVIVPAEFRDQERGFLEQLRLGEHVERQDVQRLRKDGTRIHVSMTVSPVRDRQGHIIGASTTARDVTERKAWEDRLMRSEEAQRLLVGIHDDRA